jgi:pyroglutamyl-peptidase
MTTTVLLTGFGPFPGAPLNPTGPLVEQLALRQTTTSNGIRRVAHVFPTAYDAVDLELPALLAREQPDVLLMFGLALRSRALRVETCARNALTRVVPDASGELPLSDRIAEGAPDVLPLSAPAHRLMMAARAAGVPATVSRDAGRYLCNYLCWRACEAAAQTGVPRVFAFIHVPHVRAQAVRSALRQAPFTFDDLIRAGEALIQAALAAARTRR